MITHTHSSAYLVHSDGVRGHLVDQCECHDNLGVLVRLQCLLTPVRIIQTVRG